VKQIDVHKRTVSSMTDNSTYAGNGSAVVQVSTTTSGKISDKAPSQRMSAWNAVAKGVLSNWVAAAVTGSVSFLITPMLIRGLGDFHYGMWILVFSILSYNGLLDLGMRPTLARFTARFSGSGARREQDETFTTSLALAATACAVICILALTLSGTFARFFSVQGSAYPEFRWLLVLLGVSVGVSSPAAALGAYLYGLQRFEMANLVPILRDVIRGVLLAVTIHLGYGVIACGAVTLAISIFSIGLYWKILRWCDPELSIGWNLLNWSRARELLRFSFYILLTGGGNILRFRIDAIVIGRILSLALVTPYNVASSLTVYFDAFMVSLMTPLTPVMSSLDARSQSEDLQRLFLFATKITTLFALLFVSFVLLDGRALFRLWLGQRLATASYSLLLILTVGRVAGLAQVPSFSLLLARGRHQMLGWWTLGEGLANLVLSIYWATKYGVAGVAWGTAIPMLVTKLFLQPWYTLHVVGMAWRRYVLHGIARPVVAAMIFFGSSRLIISPMHFPGLLVFLGNIVWQTLFFAILAWFIVFPSSERTLLWNRAKRFMPKRRASNDRSHGGLATVGEESALS